MLWMRHLTQEMVLGRVPWCELNTFKYWPIYINHLPWWKTDIAILGPSMHMPWLEHLLAGDSTGTWALVRIKYFL